LAELKKKPVVQHIPVVIFSTSNEQRDIADTRKLGASDFMTKPTDLTILTAYLDNILVNQSKNQNKHHEK
jgi:DNA-binding response OmpR family regulator